MSDDAYIPPSELDRYRPMIHHETGERTPGDIGLSNLMLLQVIASHAVVDSVAAELAEAARPFASWPPLKDALARFDALHKEANQ